MKTQFTGTKLRDQLIDFHKWLSTIFAVAFVLICSIGGINSATRFDSPFVLSLTLLCFALFTNVWITRKLIFLPLQGKSLEIIAGASYVLWGLCILACITLIASANGGNWPILAIFLTIVLCPIFYVIGCWRGTDQWHSLFYSSVETELSAPINENAAEEANESHENVVINVRDLNQPSDNDDIDKLLV